LKKTQKKPKTENGNPPADERPGSAIPPKPKRPSEAGEPTPDADRRDGNPGRLGIAYLLYLGTYLFEAEIQTADYLVGIRGYYYPKS
jgi:hypothetical protein